MLTSVYVSVCVSVHRNLENCWPEVGVSWQAYVLWETLEVIVCPWPKQDSRSGGALFTHDEIFMPKTLVTFFSCHRHQSSIGNLFFARILLTFYLFQSLWSQHKLFYSLSVAYLHSCASPLSHTAPQLTYANIHVAKRRCGKIRGDGAALWCAPPYFDHCWMLVTSDLTF